MGARKYYRTPSLHFASTMLNGSYSSRRMLLSTENATVEDVYNTDRVVM